MSSPALSFLEEIGDLCGRFARFERGKRQFEEGELDWTKCRVIARVATVDDQEHWIAEAKSLTSRALEKRVAREKGEPVKVRIALELSEADGRISSSRCGSCARSAARRSR